MEKQMKEQVEQEEKALRKAGKGKEAFQLGEAVRSLGLHPTKDALEKVYRMFAQGLYL